MKSARVWLVAIFIAAIALYLGLNRPPARKEALHNALILEKVQALGELHTAKYSYQDIFDYRTSMEPAQWVSHVPGGESLLRSATRNKALVSAVGSVEAGIDLRKARVQKTPTGVLVLIPAPETYEPSVRAWVRDSRSGMFWDDRNIGLKASEEAKQRFELAAIQQGILTKAESEARRTIRELLAPLAESVTVKTED